MSTSLNVTITGNAASLTSAMQQVQTSTKQTMTTMTQETTKAQGAFAKLSNFFSGGMRGLTFGLTGMVTAGIEAVGMFSMLEDSQTRVSEAQAHLNELQAQGVTSGADYQRTTNELEKAQRALRFSLRFTILSFADMIPFVLNTINSFVKVKTQAAATGVQLQTFGTQAAAAGTGMQTFGIQQKAAATSAIPLTNALRAQQVQMTVGTKSALASSVGFREMAIAEKEAQVATDGLKISLKALLISTGIGAAIVGITTFMELYATNTLDARTNTNALGEAIGKLAPSLKPFLGVLQQVGKLIMQIFGVEIPGAADTANKGMQTFTDDQLKNIDDIKAAWIDLVDEFKRSNFGEGHKGWQEQFRAIKELGFDKEGVHHIKFQLEIVETEQDVFKKLTQGLRFIKDFQLPPGDIRKFANSTIDQISDAIRDAGGQLDWMAGLKEIIRTNKKNPELPKLVAMWFQDLPANIKSHLESIGLPADEIIKMLGFEPVTLAAATRKVFDTTWSKALTGIDKTTFLEQVKRAGGGNLGLTEILFSTGQGAADATKMQQEGDKAKNEWWGAFGAITDFPPEFKAALDTAFSNAVNYVKSWGVAAGQWFGIGWTQATQFVASLKSWFNTAFATVADPVLKAAALFADAFANAWAQAKSFGTSLLTWFQLAFQGVADPVLKVAGLLAEAFSTAWAEVTSFGTNLLTWFGSAFETVAKPVVDVAVKFAEAFSASWTTVTTLGSDLKTWISDAITGTISTVIEKGKDIGTAIWTGMKSVLDGLQQTIMNFGGTIGGWIVDAIKQIFPDFDLQNPLAKPEPGAGTNPPKVTSVNLPKDTGGGPPQLAVDNSNAIAQVGDIAIAIAKLATLKPEIGVNPSPALLSVADIAIAMAKVSTFKPEIDVNNGPALLTVADIAIAMAELATFQPPIELNNKPAIKAVDVVAKRIDSLSGIKAEVNLNNKPAIKSVDVVAKRIDSLSKVKAEINLDNKKAIKAVDVVAKRIDSLSSINPQINVHVGVSGPGVRFLQHGMHGVVDKPTLLIAGEAGPERIDVTPVGGKSEPLSYERSVSVSPIVTHPAERTQSAAFNGTIIVNNVLMDETIVRRTKMQMGKNTYTMR